MPDDITPLQRAAAWAVHGYTATGAVAGFAAILATMRSDYRGAFLWLAAATVIDGTDGMLARRARVKERIPTFDGARLDDIVDYLTYVVAPLLLLYHAAILPQRFGVIVAAVVLVSSAYGFASADAKSDDFFFTGFPSYWNIVAVYLFAAQLGPAINAAVLLALSALVFLRIGYVYPSRTPVWRELTIALTVVWAAMLVAVILAIPRVPMRLLIASLVFPVYYMVLSVVLHNRRKRT
jgi:phosphatidylcholine synthase